MPEWIANLWLWVQANPWTTVAIIVYLVVNLSPRPHPDEHTGWAKAFWRAVDLLSVLTAGRVPGKRKMLFSDSPMEEPKAAAAKKKPRSAKDKVSKAEPVKTLPADEKKDDEPKDEPEVVVDGPGSHEIQGKDGSGT